MTFKKRYHFESEEDFLNYWSNEAEYFKTLLNIDNKYRDKRQKLLESFYKKLDEFEVEKSKGVTTEEFIDLYKKYVAKEMQELVQQENDEYEEFNRSN